MKVLSSFIIEAASDATRSTSSMFPNSSSKNFLLRIENFCLMTTVGLIVKYQYEWMYLLRLLVSSSILFRILSTCVRRFSSSMLCIKSDRNIFRSCSLLEPATILKTFIRLSSIIRLIEVIIVHSSKFILTTILPKAMRYRFISVGFRLNVTKSFDQETVKRVFEWP